MCTPGPPGMAPSSSTFTVAPEIRAVPVPLNVLGGRWVVHTLNALPGVIEFSSSGPQNVSVSVDPLTDAFLTIAGAGARPGSSLATESVLRVRPGPIAETPTVQVASSSNPDSVWVRSDASEDSHRNVGRIAVDDFST